MKFSNLPEGSGNLALLALAQGLFLTNNVLLFSVNGLAGMEFSTNPLMATLPLMAYVGAGALWAPLVAMLHRSWGRKPAFLSGAAVSIAAALLCAFAAQQRSLWLLSLATALGGFGNANGSLYRFAATELVPSAFRERAISWVLLGGILGAVAGPFLARLTKDALPTPYLGAFLALAVVGLASLAVVSRIQFPPAPRSDETTAASPTQWGLDFGVAIFLAAFSNGMMNLLMAATPIAMKQCHHAFSDTTGVIQAHVLAMYLPSFFTGDLIRRIGVRPVLWAGIVIYAVCLVVALSGTGLGQFYGSLVALGLGWNFLFVGSTTLFTTTYQPQHRNRAQGTMDFFGYLTLTITSFSSGALVSKGGWSWMNRAAVVPLLAMALGVMVLGISSAKVAKAKP